METAFDRHYVYHPAWAARVLAQTRPARHVDISSILGFSTVLSAFIPVDFYDVRPAPLNLGDLHVGAADLLQLPFDDNSIPSLSCMHVIEHIGLGRYGDQIDPDGDIKAIRELVRVLSPGGDLLIATPVGRRRVCFNAHRVYDHQDFAELFAGLDLVEFALIPDGAVADGLLYDPPAELVRAQEYGCGCFWFKKPASAGAPGRSALGCRAEHHGRPGEPSAGIVGDHPATARQRGHGRPQRGGGDVAIRRQHPDADVRRTSSSSSSMTDRRMRPREVLGRIADPRMRVVHQENQGLAASLNRGISLARGVYIARQDHDDWAKPTQA